ncbi:hypothetical protein [Kitasatospora sp. NPDC001175]|uniref:hypothetical protein n=1 Tax=Kitasatospora sp. NPDC001175 TaxID=3157103 RepID=UPI003D0628FC
MRTEITDAIHRTWHQVRRHLKARYGRERSDAGYTTETVIITALLIGLGIAALGILAAKVTDKANGLTF